MGGLIGWLVWEGGGVVSFITGLAASCSVFTIVSVPVHFAKDSSTFVIDMKACVQTTEEHMPQPPHGLGGMREAKTIDVL